MIVLVMLPFLVGGVLIIVFRDRLAAEFKVDRTFDADLLDEDRARRPEDRRDLRWQRVDEAWVARVLLIFGVCLVAISLLVLIGLLLGVG
jgi:hypothetical protein